MIWLQTASGRAFNLLEPTPAMVDFDIDIPEALARIPRFTGHVRAGPYCVAQHCVLGADFIWRETRDSTRAAAFLLHDAHEAYFGDIATPIMHALAARIEITGFGTSLTFGAHRIVLDQFRVTKARLDAVIHAAAGLSWPLPKDVAGLVKLYDLRMLATERMHLLGPAPRPWHPSVEAAVPLPLRGRITIWPWPKAADEYRERLTRYLPTSTIRAA